MALLYSRWHELPLHVRALLGAEFGFTKTGPTHVVNNRVEQDGFNLHEVEACLTKERIEAYVHTSSDDLHELWDLMIAKVTGADRLVEIVEAGGGVIANGIVVAIPPTEPPPVEVPEPTPEPVPEVPEVVAEKPKRKSSYIPVAQRKAKTK